MTNYTIRFYGVQFSNGHNVMNMDKVVEPISEQEYNDLVEGDCDTFTTHSAPSARVLKIASAFRFNT